MGSKQPAMLGTGTTELRSANMMRAAALGSVICAENETQAT